MDVGVGGLPACSTAELGLAQNASAACQAASEIGVVAPLTVWGALLGTKGSSVVMWLLVLPWCLTILGSTLVLLTQMLPDILRRRTRSRQLPRSAWVIHGKKYDLSPWLKDHPGGQWALELGRNRDCTGLFESYHIFADRAKLMKILARFELSDDVAVEVTADETWAKAGSDQGVVFNDAFHEDVKGLLRAHYARTGSKKMKTWVGWVVLFFFLAQAFAFYLFLQGSTVALVLLPTIAWVVSANLSHDGSHFAISERPWVNRLASYTGMPFFFNVTCWHIQHVVQHHVYTNDADDVDLYHFLPVCRVSRFTTWASHFHFQWLSLLFVLPTTVGHLLISVPLDVLTKQVDLITGKRRYSQCQNLEDFVSRFGTRIFLELMASLSFVLLSIYFQGFADGLRRAFVVYEIASFWFIIMTQGAHLQHESMVGKEGEFRSWAKRQAATSVNFRPDSRFWVFFTGGLNVQSLHHVAPCVGSSQLIEIYPEYKKLCARHGVPLKEVKNLLEFCRGFLGWIAELARDDGEDDARLRQGHGKRE